MGYNGVAVLGTVAVAGVAGGTLAQTGPDLLLWTLVGVGLVAVGLILFRLSMLRRSRA